MLAFPAKGSTDHEDEGILTELVQLSHEFSTESLKKSEGYGGMSTGEQDRKAASDLGIGRASCGRATAAARRSSSTRTRAPPPQPESDVGPAAPRRRFGGSNNYLSPL